MPGLGPLQREPKAKLIKKKFLKSIAGKRRRQRHETLIQNRLSEAEEKQLTFGHVKRLERIKIT